MIIIFGWGHNTFKNYGPTYPVNCKQCGQDTYWNLIKICTWFTLFFIPVLRYKTQYILFCGNCEKGVELRSHQIEHALELNQATTQFLNREMTEEHYESILEKAVIQ